MPRANVPVATTTCKGSEQKLRCSFPEPALSLATHTEDCGITLSVIRSPRHQDPIIPDRHSRRRRKHLKNGGILWGVDGLTGKFGSYPQILLAKKDFDSVPHLFLDTGMVVADTITEASLEWIIFRDEVDWSQDFLHVLDRKRVDIQSKVGEVGWKAWDRKHKLCCAFTSDVIVCVLANPQRESSLWMTDISMTLVLTMHLHAKCKKENERKAKYGEWFS